MTLTWPEFLAGEAASDDANAPTARTAWTSVVLDSLSTPRRTERFEIPSGNLADDLLPARHHEVTNSFLTHPGKRGLYRFNRRNRLDPAGYDIPNSHLFLSGECETA